MLAACACSVHGVTNVVHDAARDLVLNTANRNVYTNLYGGVWSYMRSTSNTGARTLLPGVRYRTGTETDASGSNFNPPRNDLAIYWERGPAKGDASPCFSVNPSPWADTNTFMRGAAYPLIQPGELSCHPGNTTDSGNQCIVLRFTVPRDGTYAVTAKAWNRNSGWTAVTLLVNGEVARARQAWKSSATAVVTNDFSLASATYAAGDTIELAVDGNNTYNSNATGLDFKIAEEVEAVYDASSAFLANHFSESPANPYTDAFGTWTAYWTTNTVPKGTFTPVGALRTRLTNVAYRRIDKGDVLAGIAWGGGLPYVIANVTGVMAAETNSAGKLLTATGRAFLPGELDIFPADGNCHATILEVIPTEGGVYDIGLTVRDMFYSTTPNENYAGANVWLMQGDQVLSKKYISVERGASYSSSDTIFFSDVRIMSRIPLAVAVDNNGSNNSDGVGTLWAFIRKGDFSATYDANVAMKANMLSASPSNPFTYNGATWTAGLCAGGWKGAFTPYTTRQTGIYGGTAEGWGQTADTSPFIRVNKSGRTITANEAGSASAIGIDALMGHPKSDNSATALRFTVPSDGIYAATMWAKDHAYDHGYNVWINSIDTGVDIHLIAGSRHAAEALIDVHPRVELSEAGKVAADRLYLKAGDTVTFAIGSNRFYNWDLTSFFAWIDPEPEAEDLLRVNIDLNGAASGETAATFTGAGRVGFAGETWNGVAAADGAANVESRQLYLSDGTNRTGVQLAVQRDDGEVAASAANLATDTAAAALFADGIVSTNSTDTYSFTLTGLLPNTSYECYFYSRALTNAPPATSASIVRGMFTAGGATATSENTWFADSFGDYARLDVRSNADGEITGSFRSVSATDSAFWCGLQILGPGFAPYIPKGSTIIFR